MYSIAHVDRDHPPKPTKFLHRRIMCGACNFKCCNGKSLSVECTPAEAKRLDLPLLFPIDGHCRCLTDDGCKHGDSRPVLCKLFPLQVKAPTRPGKPPLLITSHWTTLNCPATSDYIPDGIEDGKHIYHLQAVGGAKKNNSPPTLALDLPIDDTFPTVLEAGAEAVDELYGDGTAAAMQDKLDGPKGFGIGGTND